MGIRLPRFGWFAARPRVAWCCRWVLGSVAVLALSAWVFTTFARAAFWVPKWVQIQLVAGSVTFSTDPVLANGESFIRTVAPAHPRLGLTTRYYQWKYYANWREVFVAYFELPRAWWSRPQNGRPQQFSIRAPLWLVFALNAAPSFLAWRDIWIAWRRRRDTEREGKCHACGYSRTGLAGGVGAVCPECGTAPAL